MLKIVGSIIVLVIIIISCFIIEETPSYNKRNYIGIAAMEGNTKEVSKLLSDFDIDYSGRAGNSPLMWASEYGHVETVKYLLENGADVNKTNVWGQTSLMFASTWGFTEIVDILIDNNADINIKTRRGKTALNSAEKYGYKDIINLLEKAK
jgi:uncharacterized protein